MPISLLADVLIATVACGFALMGVVGFVNPQRIAGFFHIQASPDYRNEVRAVYGGFGILIAAALIGSIGVVGLISGDVRTGVLLTVALATGGMALGRIVSSLFDRAQTAVPAIFLGIEVAGVTFLLAAIVLDMPTV